MAPDKRSIGNTHTFRGLMVPIQSAAGALESFTDCDDCGKMSSNTSQIHQMMIRIGKVIESLQLIIAAQAKSEYRNNSVTFIANNNNKRLEFVDN